MSVILDALHKARSDRNRGRVEPSHEQTVARVLDAAAVDAVDSPVSAPRPSRRREWMLAFAVVMAVAILFALVAGAFLLIYQQLREIGGSVGAAVEAPAPVHVTAGHNGLQHAAGLSAPVFTEVLPPPVPVAELPVEPPVSVAAAASTDVASGTGANTTPLASREDFSLGSIVCENNDCLASLNGRSVRVGDVMRGYEVMAIDSTSIRLKAANGEHEIALSLFD